MKNDYVCIADSLPTYLDSEAYKKGISIEEWEKDQVFCSHCSDKKGEPLCPEYNFDNER